MRQIIILLIFCMVAFNQAQAQGIDFFEGSWAEALEAAKQQEKAIFVDAYAVWCGPCKRMANNVFPQKKVGDVFNKYFINVKMDMERGEGLSFRQKYPVSAFPTLFWIDSQGKVIHKVRGAQQAEALIQLGKMVVGKMDYSLEYAAKYEKGDRDPDLIYKYVKSLNKSGKSSIKVANEYLNSQKDLTTPHNLKFILEATTEADSRIFDLLIQHRKAIEALSGQQAVKDKIEKACQRTVEKALEYEVSDLVEEAKRKMKKHYAQKARPFALQSDLKFYLATSDVQNYLKCCEDYVKKEVKDDAQKLHDLAQEIRKNFPKENKAMQHAEKLAKMATDQAVEYQYYFTYANILFDNGKKSDALRMANRSLELAKKDKNVSMAIQRLIQKIEQS